MNQVLSEKKKKCEVISLSFSCLVPQARKQAGGNVKINVDRIAAKSGRNGGNFAAELNHHHLAVFLAAIRCRLPPTQLFFAFLCFAELLVLQRAGLSQFISLTLLERQCVGGTTTSNQAQNLQTNLKLDDLVDVAQFWKIPHGQISTSSDHWYHLIKVRLRFLLYF